MSHPNVLKKIFWDYRKSLIGLPLVYKMALKAVIPPAAIFGTLFVAQYALVSSDYYDEYDGTATEAVITKLRK